MSFKTAYIEPIFFVRWIAPTVMDTHIVTGRFREEVERAGRSLTYVAIVPEECGVPDDATRTAMVAERDKVILDCDAMYIVMEGAGFKHAILRNAMAAMLLVVGSRDKRVVVGRSLDEALSQAARSAPPERRFSVPAVMAKALAAGVATPPASKVGSP